MRIHADASVLTHNDNYPTPPWCTARLLDGLDAHGAIPQLGEATVVEPCAGEGWLVRGLVEWSREHTGSAFAVWANEVRQCTSHHLVHAGASLVDSVDACEFIGGLSPDARPVIVANPPWSHRPAARMMLAAMAARIPSFWLVPVQWLCSTRLHPVWQQAGGRTLAMPLPDRPHFLPHNKHTGKSDCMWLGLDVDIIGLRPGLSVLERTPMSERERDRAHMAAYFRTTDTAEEEAEVPMV